MGIRANFDMTGIKQFMQKKIQIIENEIVSRLQYLGEECVNHARNLNTYKDQTGNLRSSIGYVVVVNGSIVVNGSFTGNNEGTKSGNDYANELAKNHPIGYVLIVVAGMNYAKYVEAMGLDVLSSAELLAKKELPKMLKELKRVIKKAA